MLFDERYVQQKSFAGKHFKKTQKNSLYIY